jgi:hypothetical protein
MGYPYQLTALCITLISMTKKREGTVDPTQGQPPPVTRTRRTAPTRIVEEQLSDPETGEVRIWHRVEVIKRRGRSAGQITQAEFSMFYDEHLPRLLTLTGVQSRTFMALVDSMGFNGPFRYSTAEIAVAIGSPVPSISRALRDLRRLGIIIEVGHREIYLDPRIVWRGDITERNIAVAHLERDGLLVKRIIPADPEGALA